MVLEPGYHEIRLYFTKSVLFDEMHFGGKYDFTENQYFTLKTHFSENSTQKS